MRRGCGSGGTLALPLLCTLHEHPYAGLCVRVPFLQFSRRTAGLAAIIQRA